MRAFSQARAPAEVTVFVQDLAEWFSWRSLLGMAHLQWGDSQRSSSTSSCCSHASRDVSSSGAVGELDANLPACRPWASYANEGPWADLTSKSLTDGRAPSLLPLLMAEASRPSVLQPMTKVLPRCHVSSCVVPEMRGGAAAHRQPACQMLHKRDTGSHPSAVLLWTDVRPPAPRPPACTAGPAGPLYAATRLQPHRHSRPGLRQKCTRPTQPVQGVALQRMARIATQAGWSAPEAAACMCLLMHAFPADRDS